MAIDSSSYGSVAKVEALTRRYTNSSGNFDTTTTPTLTAVESFIDDISDTIDVVLATYGFSVPVTQATATAMLGRLVVGYSVELVHLANSAGRFFDKKKPAGNPFMVFEEELSDWVERHAAGLQRLGVTRTYDVTAGLQYRDTDESGDDTHPLFQREAFGETYRNWDA